MVRTKDRKSYTTCHKAANRVARGLAKSAYRRLYAEEFRDRGCYPKRSSPEGIAFFAAKRAEREAARRAARPARRPRRAPVPVVVVPGPVARRAVRRLGRASRATRRRFARSVPALGF